MDQRYTMQSKHIHSTRTKQIYSPTSVMALFSKRPVNRSPTDKFSLIRLIPARFELLNSCSGIISFFQTATLTIGWTDIRSTCVFRYPNSISIREQELHIAVTNHIGIKVSFANVITYVSFCTVSTRFRTPGN